MHATVKLEGLASDARDLITFWPVNKLQQPRIVSGHHNKQREVFNSIYHSKTE